MTLGHQIRVAARRKFERVNETRPQVLPVIVKTGAAFLLVAHETLDNSQRLHVQLKWKVLHQMTLHKFNGQV